MEGKVRKSMSCTFAHWVTANSGQRPHRSIGTRRNTNSLLLLFHIFFIFFLLHQLFFSSLTLVCLTLFICTNIIIIMVIIAIIVVYYVSRKIKRERVFVRRRDARELFFKYIISRNDIDVNDLIPHYLTTLALKN